VPDLNDVRRIATALPEVSEHSGGHTGRSWKVKERLFVWERPLRAGDIAALGDQAPEGTVLAARIADDGVKQALIASDPTVYFTVPHFNGYNAILVRLDVISDDELEELIIEAWLDRAPPRVRKGYDAQGGGASRSG
jgi:hypothetical protein